MHRMDTCDITRTRDPVVDRSIEVRRACANDVPALLALHRSALRALSGEHYSAAQIESLLRHVPTLDRPMIDDGTYYVLCVDGISAACGGWSTRAPGYSRRLAFGVGSMPYSADTALVRAMYTHPSWVRRGFARRVLTVVEAAAWAAGHRRMELDATLPGVPLYRACGYETVSTIRTQLPDGLELPVVRMAKRLDRPRRP